MAIKKFISGKFYVYKGTDLHSNWVDSMDFCLDGKPHICKTGNGVRASFYDSSNPRYMWHWDSEMPLWEEAKEKVTNWKKRMEKWKKK